jgi:hypothetical protein
MSNAVDDLVLDLLEWLGERPRSYADVLEVWRTSCPRLPVWEEANDRGFVTRQLGPSGAMVCLSALGSTYLAKSGRS